MFIHRRSLRRLLFALVLGAPALAIGVGSPGCDDAYEPPCKITTRRVLASDPTIGARPGIALVRARDRVVASWIRRDVLEAGTSPDAATGGPSLTSFEVAIVDAQGNVTTRATVPTPEALRTRRAGIDDVGVVAVDAAFVVHWTETSVSTDPDGRVRTASAVKASRITGQVAAEPVTLFSCERCSTAAVFMPVAADALALVKVDPDLPPDTLGALAETRFIAARVRADGSAVELAAPPLAIAPQPITDGGLGGVGLAGSSPATELSADVSATGHITIISSGRSWLADDALRLVAGPILLPKAPDVNVVWEPSGEAAIAWSVSPFEEGRADDEVVPREIFTGIVPSGAPALTVRERTSGGRAVLAFDRQGDDLGALFESAGRTLFASLDRSGKKRGGDVLVGSVSTNGSEYGSAAVPEAHAVFARGDHRFTIVALGAGELVATEVACAP